MHSDHALLRAEDLHALLDAIATAIGELDGSITVTYDAHLIVAMAT